VYASASQSLSTYLYEYYQSDENPMSFFTTNNMCCRRRDFLSIGGFDERFTIASEDRDYSLRWKDAGGAMLYAPDALVMHAHDLSLRSFWKQHRNYGKGARYLHRALDARDDARPKVERAGFYSGLLLHPLKRKGHARVGQSILMGLSQVAMVSGYYAEVRNERANTPHDA
jgi:GT2 family glycosyltransferase